MNTNKVIITGAGHSGTNLVLEILRAHNKWTTFPLNGMTEDREIMTRFPNKLPENYLTKLCTENHAITKENINKLLENNPDLLFLFCIRNPVDTALARVAKYYTIDGATAESVIKEIEFANEILDFLYQEHYDSLRFCFMKNIVEDFENYAEIVIKTVDPTCTSISDAVKFSYKNIRIDDKRKKYKGKLDPRQGCLRNNLESIYGDFWEQPFYKKQKEIIEKFMDQNVFWRNIYW